MPRKYTRRAHVPVGPSIAYIELTQGQWSLIDADDAGSVEQRNWCAMRVRKSDDFYVFTTIRIDGRKKLVGMHSFILNPRPGYVADHINGRRTDNRRCNLREATIQQNNINQGKKSHNTSGYRGVFLLKSRNRWFAKIVVNGKPRHLGYFDSAEEASRAYVESAKMYHGEFFRAA